MIGFPEASCSVTSSCTAWPTETLVDAGLTVTASTASAPLTGTSHATNAAAVSATSDAFISDKRTDSLNVNGIPAPPKKDARVTAFRRVCSEQRLPNVGEGASRYRSGGSDDLRRRMTSARVAQ